MRRRVPISHTSFTVPIQKALVMTLDLNSADSADGTLASDVLDSLFGDGEPVSVSVPEAHLTVAVASDDVAALYVDGVLAYGGDHYSVYLRAAEEAGIAIIETDDFLLGREPDVNTIALAAAPTLAVFREYRDVTKRAIAMRDRAASLLEQADALEAGLEEKIGPVPSPSAPEPVSDESDD